MWEPPCVQGAWRVASVAAVRGAVAELVEGGFISWADPGGWVVIGSAPFTTAGSPGRAQWTLVVRDAAGVRLRIRHHVACCDDSARGKVGVEGSRDAAGFLQHLLWDRVVAAEAAVPADDLYDPFDLSSVGLSDVLPAHAAHVAVAPRRARVANRRVAGGLSRGVAGDVSGGVMATPTGCVSGGHASVVVGRRLVASVARGIVAACLMFAVFAVVCLWCA